MTSKQSPQMPPIAITMGCPAGIGPEIIVKYHASLSQAKRPLVPVVVGDSAVLRQTADYLGLPVDIKVWQPGMTPESGCLNVMDVSKLDPGSFAPGHPTVTTGKAMAAYIEQAAGLCLDGYASAMTTCPIAKTVLNQAGDDFPGHTEFLAQLTGADAVAMMMAGSRLRVVLATIHCSISRVPSLLDSSRLFALITLTEHALRTDFSIAAPRIAVAGLNPHAGEDSLFGSEERELIAPAVEQAAASGIDASGPYPPDTVFYRAASGRFDAVICMYHDQGLIPFKLLHFEDGVNVTLGLPIIRTSVDHGTAYDIAGTGTAQYSSLKAAVEMAADFAANRRHRIVADRP